MNWILIWSSLLYLSDLPFNGTAAEWHGHHAGGSSEEDPAPGAAAGHDYLKGKDGEGNEGARILCKIEEGRRRRWKSVRINNDKLLQ